MLTRFLKFLRPRHLLDYLGYFVVVPIIVTCFYWAWVDTDPVIESFSEVATPVVRQGEDFEMRYNVHWGRSCRLTGHRFVVDADGQIYTVESDTRYINQGPDEFTIAVPVPLAARPGPAKYRATLIYECNPWQRFIKPLLREVSEREFVITPGVPTAGGLSFMAPMQCSRERPVLVAAHCRGNPVRLARDD